MSQAGDNPGAYESPAAAAAAPERVPESWPPADPFEPVAPRRIHWLLAIPVAIPAVLFPRRMGPHLAASSWLAAYAAHLFWTLVAVGTLFALGMEQSEPEAANLKSLFLVNPLVEVRRALAGVVLLAYATLNTWTDVAIALLVTALVELGFWIAGVVMIPLYAAGEGPRRTYLRCVKLLLWSSVFQALMAWVYPRIVLAIGLFGDTWAFAGAALLELWWLVIIFRLGARYAGPKEGPRWQERQPHCEACGYSLVSLSPEGRCPECGERVANSLPNQRHAPAFASARGLSGRFVGFFVTTWHTLFARRFATRTAIWSCHRAARNYAVLVCLAIGLLATTTSVSVYWHRLDPYRATSWDHGPSAWQLALLRSYEFVAVSLLIGIGAGLGALAWMLLVGLFLGRFGFRDVADRVVILCYSTAWLLVPLLLGVAGGWAAYGIIECWGPFGGFYIREIGTIDYDVAIWLACLIPCAVTFLMSFLRVRTLLRHSRFANA